MSSCPEITLAVGHDQSYALKGWEDFERWCVLNDGMWNMCYESAQLHGFSEADRYKYLLWHLMELLNIVRRDFHEYTEKFGIFALPWSAEYWSLDCDVLRGPKNAAVKVADAVSPGDAKALVERLNKARENYTSLDQQELQKLHPASRVLVVRFATALAEKMRAAEEKYGYANSWEKSDWQKDWQKAFEEHIGKGDPRDVAIYCAFAWHHGWATRKPVADTKDHEWWITNNGDSGKKLRGPYASPEIAAAVRQEMERSSRNDHLNLCITPLQPVKGDSDA